MSNNLQKEYPNMAMFVGTTPNIGTTAAAFGAAAQLAAGSRQLRIGYLCLNLKSSKISRYLGLSAMNTGLSALRAELKAQAVTPERLEKHCVRLKHLPNLYVLNGNMQREQAELFTPEDMEQLLECAAQAFDLCVADCSSYWDNAATVVTALRARVRLLVTLPQLDSFQDDYRSWILNTASLFGITPRQFSLIIAQTGKQAEEYRANEVQQSTGIPIAAKLSYDSLLSQYMQQGQLCDWIKNSRTAARGLEDLVRMLARTIPAEWSPPAEPRLMAKFRFRGVKRSLEVNP